MKCGVIRGSLREVRGSRGSEWWGVMGGDVGESRWSRMEKVRKGEILTTYNTVRIF